MTPDELRALADALQRMADDDSGIPQWERDTTSRAATYLRAQADAQPVAEVNDRYSRDGYNDEISVLLPVGTKLYTQPAAPQVEPKREPLSDEPPRGFVRWVRNNMPPNTVISNPDWWAMQLWRAAMRAHRIGGSDAE